VVVVQKLIQHIEALLEDNNFIIIPEFGGFVAEAAGSFETNGTLYPPHKSIGFNPSLTYNDGLLAQQYAKELNISIADASALLSTTIQKMKNALSEWKHLKFGAIGMFHLTDSGIIFEPFNQNTFLRSSYGLVPIFFPKLSNNLASGKEEEIKQEKQEVNRIEERRESTFIYKAVSIAAILLLLVLFPINITDSRHQGVKIENQASILPATDTLLPIQEATSDKIDTISSKYNIIIGSLYSYNKAQQFINELPNKIEDSCKIIFSEHRYRVSIKTFNSEDECDSFLESFVKNNPLYADAWILETTENLSE